MKLKNLSNRIGKFMVVPEEIRNINNDNLTLIFKDMLIVRAEYLFASDCFEYVALCKHFDDIEQCSPIEYRGEITSDKGKTVKVTWKKVGDQ